MASVDSTLHLGEIFLETADGTKISLGQLKAPFSISIAPPKVTAPTEIKIGSTVEISENPKCVEFGGDRGGYVNPKFRGRVGVITGGPSERGDWHVAINGVDFAQLISPEHLTVVS